MQPHTVLIYKSTGIRYYVGMSPKYESMFTQRVIEEIEKARVDAHLSVADLVKRSGMPRNSFFTKIRGDRAFTTDDVDSLARALGLDPFLILRRASGGLALHSVPDVGGGEDDDATEWELRQAAHRLHGQQVGTTWVIPRAEVEARRERTAA